MLGTSLSRQTDRANTTIYPNNLAKTFSPPCTFRFEGLLCECYAERRSDGNDCFDLLIFYKGCLPSLTSRYWMSLELRKLINT